MGWCGSMPMRIPGARPATPRGVGSIGTPNRGPSTCRSVWRPITALTRRTCWSPAVPARPSTSSFAVSADPARRHRDLPANLRHVRGLCPDSGSADSRRAAAAGSGLRAGRPRSTRCLDAILTACCSCARQTTRPAIGSRTRTSRKLPRPCGTGLRRPRRRLRRIRRRRSDVAAAGALRQHRRAAHPVEGHGPGGRALRRASRDAAGRGPAELRAASVHVSRGVRRGGRALPRAGQCGGLAAACQPC